MLPHVDAFMPVHNLDSLKQLVEALGRSDGARPPGARVAGRRR
jgi:uncharacterized protein with von Willebrand factor type A (vWA) domain